MLALADLLSLWTALAGVAAAPAGLRVAGPDAAGGVVDGHWPHPIPTLVCCLRGTVRTELAGGRQMDLGPGWTLLLLAGTPHRHAPLRRGSASIELGFDPRGADIDLRGDGGAFVALLPEQPARQLVDRLAVSADDVVQRQALSAVWRLPLEAPLHEAQRLPAAIERMRERLMTRGMGRLDAEGLTAASGLGRSQAWRLFRQHLGCTPRQAIERRRVQVAAGLIAAGAPVGEAARRCGFDDRGTFARACRRVLGKAPSRIRLAEG